MKKKAMLFLLLFQMATLSACGKAADEMPLETDSIQVEKSEIGEEEQDREEIDITENEPEHYTRVLVAYFSQPTDVDISDLDAVSGASLVVRDDEVADSTTEYVARMIQETVGGDLFRIETVDEYPSDYDELVAQARTEKGENARPELARHIENPEQYDTVILGYPSWISDMPMPVYSFLEEYDFGAKTIIPFVTHGGSGFRSTIDAISELQPGAHVSGNGLSIARDDLADREEEIRQWAESLNLNEEERTPENSSDTVADAAADPQHQQTLYLWEEGNMPAITEYTENSGYYADDPDFRPYMVTFPVPEGTEIKGAVLICAGGAFQFRSDQNEGTPVAQALSEAGYQSFVVNYRLRPYTQEEGALDLARAVRFVRKNADVYGIDEKDIAVMGFSAGGILAGEMLLNFDGTVNGTALDSDYAPDALDGVSADAAADGMIYSFYGRLSVASKDVEKFAASDLPPTYFCYGTRDPFVREFEACIKALQEAGVPVEVDVLEGRPHGYGYTEGWIPAYAEWLENVFKNNSAEDIGEKAARIPDTPLQIPEEYYAQASEQGTLERLEYTTYESFSYEERTKQLTKTAYVYLPYGYSEDRQYNVFYLMHGGWSNETTYLGTPENPNIFKNVVDHAVQDGRMEPVIIVCPTYNNENPNDSDDYGLALRLTDNYHNELLNDLIPAVEGKYSTFAEGISLEELERSRDHRAFCGFSMGSVTTWHTFEYCLPYFRYFLPSSGDLTSDGSYMESIVTGSGYGPKDFFIYAMSGTQDFAYSAFSRQIQAMLEAPGGIFIEADNEEDGNLAYRVQEGNEHNGEAAMQYIYNGLVWLWKERSEALAWDV